MTAYETYEYLFRVRNIDKEIDNLTAEYESLELCLLPRAIQYEGEKVQTSPQDFMSDTLSKIGDIRTDIEKMYMHRAKTVDEITSRISQLENIEEQTVLIKYYLAKKTVEDIAEEIGYSVRSTYYVKKRGVTNLAKLL